MNREVEKLLLDSGFRFVKSKKHQLWSNGTVTLAMSHGNHTSQHTLRSLRSKLNRINKGLPLTPERFTGKRRYN